LKVNKENLRLEQKLKRRKIEKSSYFIFYEYLLFLSDGFEKASGGFKDINPARWRCR